MHQKPNLSRTERLALEGVMSPIGPTREQRRALKRRMRKPIKGITPPERRQLEELSTNHGNPQADNQEDAM